MDEPANAGGHGHGYFPSNPVPPLPKIFLMDFLDLKMIAGLYVTLTDQVSYQTGEFL
jgi:hypothetical protein